MERYCVEGWTTLKPKLPSSKSDMWGVLGSIYQKGRSGWAPPLMDIFRGKNQWSRAVKGPKSGLSKPYLQYIRVRLEPLKDLQYFKWPFRCNFTQISMIQNVGLIIRCTCENQMESSMCRSMQSLPW